MKRLAFISNQPLFSKLVLAALLLCSAGTRAAVLLESDGHHDHHDDEYEVHGYYAPGYVPPHSGDYVLGPTAPWPSSTITYSFMGTGTSTGGESGHGATFTSFADMFAGLPGWKAEIEAAFASWEAIAGLNFVEVADDGVAWDASPTTGHGDIRFGGATFDGAGGTLAHGYYPPPNGNTAAGDIHFDTAETWKIGFGGGGFDIFQVAAHEIGHAIGLDHTAVGGSLMLPNYTEAFSGPQADDIAGAQAMYGEAFGPAIPEPSTGLLFTFAMVLLLRMRNLTPEELSRVLSFAGVPSAPAPVPVRREWKRLRKAKKSASRGY